MQGMVVVVVVVYKRRSYLCALHVNSGVYAMKMGERWLSAAVNDANSDANSSNAWNRPKPPHRDSVA
jgi:hypothetical protein